MAKILKLATTNGFVVSDYPDAAAAGVLRVGRKILQSSATDLCRSATYTFASHQVARSGASAGLNAEGEAVADGLAALADELADDGRSGGLCLLAAKGVPEGTDLGPVSAPASAGPEALAATVVAAASWASKGRLEGVRFAVEESKANPIPAPIVSAMEADGAVRVEVDGVADKPWLVWGADTDIILTGSRPGALNHQGTPLITASAIVPWGPIPVTTRALAMLGRQGVTYVPDFISAAGALLAAVEPSSFGPAQLATATADCLDRAASGSEGLFLGAVEQAEAFLAGWQDKAPFGRPLAA